MKQLITALAILFCLSSTTHSSPLPSPDDMDVVVHFWLLGGVQNPSDYDPDQEVIAVEQTSSPIEQVDPQQLKQAKLMLSAINLNDWIRTIFLSDGNGARGASPANLRLFDDWFQDKARRGVFIDRLAPFYARKMTLQNMTVLTHFAGTEAGRKIFGPLRYEAVKVNWSYLRDMSREEIQWLITQRGQPEVSIAIEQFTKLEEGGNKPYPAGFKELIAKDYSEYVITRFKPIFLVNKQVTEQYASRLSEIEAEFKQQLGRYNLDSILESRNLVKKEEIQQGEQVIEIFNRYIQQEEQLNIQLRQALDKQQQEALSKMTEQDRELAKGLLLSSRQYIDKFTSKEDGALNDWLHSAREILTLAKNNLGKIRVRKGKLVFQNKLAAKTYLDLEDRNIKAAWTLSRISRQAGSMAEAESKVFSSLGK